MSSPTSTESKSSGGGQALPEYSGERATPAVKLPVKGQRNILVTSALPYVNNVPHLGNIIGCVLSADVYSRFVKLRGHNSIYICGTDEYGTATETKALQAGLSCQQICDKYHAIHKDIYEWFRIDFSYFGRTTTPFQTKIAQDIFHRNAEEKHLVQKDVVQLFDPTCGRFLADRLVEGTCPECGYDNARGDQCDKCQQLLSAIDLIKPRCTVCGEQPTDSQTERAPLQKKSSSHLFLDLPALSDRLKSFVSDNKKSWSANSVRSTENWFQKGLEPRCITRDLKWGTPVPQDGFRDKVFYVWFDAPIGYISITAQYCAELEAQQKKLEVDSAKLALQDTTWQQWWRNPKDVELVQFMGKDNIIFHCVIFPSTLLATHDDWTMLRRISTTEYLNYEQGKFSKSRGMGVFGDGAKSTGIDADVFRYYLLANRPETADTTFRWKDFQSRNNSELVANLGNFCNRSIDFLHSRLGGEIGTLSPSDLTDGDRKLISGVEDLVTRYVQALESLESLRTPLRLLMELSKLGNGYLQEQQPWVLLRTKDADKKPKSEQQIAEDRARALVIQTVAVHVGYVLAVLAVPYLPGTSEKIAQQLNVQIPETPLSDAHFNSETKQYVFPLNCLAGRKLGKPQLLFTNIEDKCVAKFRKQFSGEANNKSAGEAKGNGKDGKQGTGSSSKGESKSDTSGKLAGLPAELRLGQVVDVRDHSKMKKFYVLLVNVGAGNGVRDWEGEEKCVRQVVTPLKGKYESDALLGKAVVVACNVKPSKFKKEEVEGSLLQCKTAGSPSLVTTDSETKEFLGSLVYPEGSQAPNDFPQLPNPKAVIADLSLDQDGYHVVPMYTGGVSGDGAGQLKTADGKVVIYLERGRKGSTFFA